CQQYSSLPVTF
nr:immunoglobulin light chain junction region [Macaca mulatta]MOX85886.1 immunoglobulin light chain junction region [Macaca mulatta]MOX86985.1 immunoglobulin light chain junction region [Macaca mulatta]MOX87564.1 immunoglobulin light chain junction region [Macaca mulatta]MOX88209.1 immunoglobulin light chain junction region [Macaca mulatta]